MCYDFLLFIHILGDVPFSKGANCAIINVQCVIHVCHPLAPLGVRLLFSLYPRAYALGY